MKAAEGAAPRTPATLAQARHALRSGSAVVLPNPAPLTHVVTATTAIAVNQAKQRPDEQPVALWAHHRDTLDALTGLWDLAPLRRTTVLRLLAEEHLTVLLPAPAHVTLPSWLEPAVKDGWMLLFGARWQPLRPLLDDHPVLYVSSANRTGRPPAADTGEALAMFPPTVPVLHLPDADQPQPRTTTQVRRATTTVRMTSDGQLHLHRHGAQDHAHGDADDYLRRLRTRHTERDGSRSQLVQESRHVRE
ncbi:Sua5/YciO/YrdC/YwlC family protein [Streptomyces sp. NPDC057027]|uniref:Sua5/YciO/YrdC/YwlC family protein n=1 Tax=Streptomyces sp. NPDC057027 TaxID=3346004 RepID=UPI003634FAE8